MKELIEQIKAEQKKQGLSIKDLANATGKDASSIYRYYNGDDPTLSTFIKMAKAVKLKINLHI